jgi:hypothetical protein
VHDENVDVAAELRSKLVMNANEALVCVGFEAAAS